MKKKYMKLTFFFIIITLLFILFLNNTNNIERFQTLDSTVYDIIIVAGQSNAEGNGIRNVCDNIALAGCSRIDIQSNSTSVGAITTINGYDILSSQIKMFTAENDPRIPNSITQMSEPLQTFYYRDSTNDGFSKLSFASSFVKEYLALNTIGTRKILVVGCAWSGASMFTGSSFYWKKPIGYPNVVDENSLYQRIIGRLQAVRNRLSSSNSSKVVAFLWHQGETDMVFTCSSTNPTTLTTRKNAYKQALKNIKENP